MRIEDTVPLVDLDPVSGEYIVLVKALDDHGLQYITRDRTLSRYNVRTRVEFLVSPSDYDEADSILRQVGTDLLDAVPTFCPKCDGEEISRRHRLLLWLFQREVFHCASCGHEWRPGVV